MKNKYKNLLMSLTICFMLFTQNLISQEFTVSKKDPGDFLNFKWEMTRKQVVESEPSINLKHYFTENYSKTAKVLGKVGEMRIRFEPFNGRIEFISFSHEFEPSIGEETFLFWENYFEQLFKKKR